jgi:fido (protein-threonine AMPylation protein)
MSGAPSLKSQCPEEWNYDAHPQYSEQLIDQKLKPILIKLKSGTASDIKAICFDSRPIHGQIFSDLTPVGMPYFAGNYRGTEGYECLKRDVKIFGKKGAPWQRVAAEMYKHHELHQKAVHSLIIKHSAGYFVDPRKFLFNCALVAAVFLEHFYRIHPYADGNGHAGRVSVWALMGLFGYWMKHWKFTERPPEIDEAIADFQNTRNPHKLVNVLLKGI